MYIYNGNWKQFAQNRFVHITINDEDGDQQQDCGEVFFFARFDREASALV